MLFSCFSLKFCGEFTDFHDIFDVFFDKIMCFRK